MLRLPAIEESFVLNAMMHLICVRKCPLSLGLLVIASWLVGNPAYAKRNDDLVVMKNGDRFTGEIKKLEHGILYFKSSYMLESVQLDWAQVDKLESKDQFFVGLQNGKRYTGGIEKVGEVSQPAVVRLDTEGGGIEIKQADVISIQQSEGGFWSQLNGSVDYGLSYSSGNSALSSSLGAGVEYQRTKTYVSLATSSQFQQPVEWTEHQSLHSGRPVFSLVVPAVVLWGPAGPPEERSAGPEPEDDNRSGIRTNRDTHGPNESPRICGNRVQP